MFCFEHDFREWKYRNTAGYIGLHFNHENCNCIELQLIVFQIISRSSTGQEYLFVSKFFYSKYISEKNYYIEMNLYFFMKYFVTVIYSN